MAYQEQIQQLQSQREQALGHLKSQWKIEADALEQSGLKTEQFKKADAQLVAKYRMKTLELDSAIGQQVQQVQQIQDMIQNRRMSEQEGFRQMQDVSGGPVPRVQRAERRPFTPGQRNTIAKDQDQFIDAMELDPAKRSIWTGKKREIRDIGSMKEKYMEWVDQSGYMWFTPKQKQQADKEWDDRLRADKTSYMYSAWFGKTGKPIPWVNAVREKMSGRRNIRSIMAGKVMSPIGRSIAPKQRQQPKREKRFDPAGIF